MDENKSGLYIVAIVGVIAVVAMVVLVLEGSSVKTPVLVGTNAEDPAGRAYYDEYGTGDESATGLSTHGRCAWAYNDNSQKIKNTCFCLIVNSQGQPTGNVEPCTAYTGSDKQWSGDELAGFDSPSFNGVGKYDNLDNAMNIFNVKEQQFKDLATALSDGKITLNDYLKQVNSIVNQPVSGGGGGSAGSGGGVTASATGYCLADYDCVGSGTCINGDCVGGKSEGPESMMS